jgi:hypothetical protein
MIACLLTLSCPCTTFPRQICKLNYRRSCELGFGRVQGDQSSNDGNTHSTASAGLSRSDGSSDGGANQKAALTVRLIDFGRALSTCSALSPTDAIFPPVPVLFGVQATHDSIPYATHKLRKAQREISAACSFLIAQR